MKPVISFVGNSGSGKTTLLEGVLAELKRLGYRVATVKHTRHSYEMDRAGKDTWRLAQAGSDIVVISSPDGIAMFERVEPELTLPQIVALFTNRVDLVLTEGYKDSTIPKILVTDSTDKEPPRYSGETLATVTARRHPSGRLQFDPADITDIAKLILYNCGIATPVNQPGLKD